jgi:hypothetical protein
MTEQYTLFFSAEERQRLAGIAALEFSIPALGHNVVGQGTTAFIDAPLPPGIDNFPRPLDHPERWAKLRDLFPPDVVAWADARIKQVQHEVYLTLVQHLPSRVEVAVGRRTGATVVRQESRVRDLYDAPGIRPEYRPR